MDARRRADRLTTIRLRFSINSYLDDRGLTRPAEIGTAVGLPPADAVKLLTRRRYRDGDIEALRRAAERLGLAETPSGRWIPSEHAPADGR
jgi:hypothetical protein